MIYYIKKYDCFDSWHEQPLRADSSEIIFLTYNNQYLCQNSNVLIVFLVASCHSVEICGNMWKYSVEMERKSPHD